MKALSIVFPSGTKIAQGQKTIEVRSWNPELSPNEDLLIVENKRFLRNEGETDLDGIPIAIVRVKSVRDFLESDVSAACASSWQSGYYSWILTDVRPILNGIAPIVAKRGIFDAEWPAAKEPFVDPARSLESAIDLNLQLTPEERIEAHENARQLMTDLQEAGKVLRAAESQGPS